MLLAGYLLFSGQGGGGVGGTTIVDGVDIEMIDPVDVDILEQYDMEVDPATADVEILEDIDIEVDC